MSEELGSFIILHEEDGDSWLLDPRDAALLEAKVDEWLVSGRDTLLHLTTLQGEPLCTSASMVKKWQVSTPAGRQRAYMLERAQNDERRAFREAAGLPWEDAQEGIE